MVTNDIITSPILQSYKLHTFIERHLHTYLNYKQFIFSTLEIEWKKNREKFN